MFTNLEQQKVEAESPFWIFQARVIATRIFTMKLT